MMSELDWASLLAIDGQQEELYMNLSPYYHQKDNVLSF